MKDRGDNQPTTSSIKLYECTAIFRTPHNSSHGGEGNQISWCEEYVQSITT